MQGHREIPGCWSHRYRKLPTFVDWKQDWKELHWSHKEGGSSSFPLRMVSADSWFMLTSTWTQAGLAPTSLCQGRVTKARAEGEHLALHLECKIGLGPMIIYMDSACNCCIQVSESWTRREVLSKHFCNLLTYTLPLQEAISLLNPCFCYSFLCYLRQADVNSPTFDLNPEQFISLMLWKTSPCTNSTMLPYPV